MRIFQIINVRWFNATAWYAITLSRLLMEAGHEVTVLTEPGTDTDKKARELGLNTVAVDLNTTNPVRFASATRHIIELIRTHRPHIVNCHRGEGFFLWGLLKLAGFPFKLVRTRGDQRPPRNDIFNRWLHAKVADAVVVTNRRMANYFLDKMHTPSRGLWLIHGGVDTDHFAFDEPGRNAVRKEFGFSADHHVVGLLGRFDHVKGHQYLIEAVSILRKEGLDNIRLFLIGFDTSMSTTEIQSVIDKNGIVDITTISGKRSDVTACLSALDTGVIASTGSETIARAALEIMAAERPLISTSVGVMPDLVSPPMLTEPENARELAEAIKSIATDDTLRKEIVDIQKRTMSQLTLEEFLKRSLNLYQSILDGA